MPDKKVEDGFTPMFASVVVDDIELKPASRKLVGVKVTFPTDAGDKGKVQFDRPLDVDLSHAGASAMIGFFLTRDAEGWQLLLRTHGGKVPVREVGLEAIAGLEVLETIPPV